MVSAGVVGEAVGIDYSEALLEEARREASTLGLPLTYHQMNTNTADFPPGPVRPRGQLCGGAPHRHDRPCLPPDLHLLPDDGCFLSFDYVGPHRTSTRPAPWERAWAVNNELPEHLRNPWATRTLIMLQVDPTEAIHSELIVETLHRYFHVQRFGALGGAIAYPILTHNERLFTCRTRPSKLPSWRGPPGRRGLPGRAPDSTLFAYMVATPNEDCSGGRGASPNGSGRRGAGGQGARRRWRLLPAHGSARRRPPGHRERRVGPAAGAGCRPGRPARCDPTRPGGLETHRAGGSRLAGGLRHAPVLGPSTIGSASRDLLRADA